MTGIDNDIVQTLVTLREGPRSGLAGLATSEAPLTPGIYALWLKHELLYVGIARTDPAQTTNQQAAGVKGRLGTYLRARLTSDFTVAVLLRFVVPQLTQGERDDLAAGRIGTREIHALTKRWVAEHVAFSTCSTSAPVAIAAEAHARRFGLEGTGPPSLNPIR